MFNEIAWLSTAFENYVSGRREITGHVDGYAYYTTGLDFNSQYFQLFVVVNDWSGCDGGLSVCCSEVAFVVRSNLNTVSVQKFLMWSWDAKPCSNLSKSKRV